MDRNIIGRSIFLAGIMAASAAFGGSDIVKCIDQVGHATLTDAPCAAGEASVAVEVHPEALAVEPAAAAPAPVSRLRAIERVAAVAMPVRHDNWSGKPQADRMLARDVATLKAARLSMQVLDNAAAMARHQRLAGLN